MEAVELKKSVLRYIDNADSRLLKMIKALVESYQEEETDYEVSEEHKKLLDERLKEHKANPTAGKDWAVLKSELRTKYGA